MTERTGLCECGCGGRTNLARQTKRARGDVAGEPLRFILGHGGRGAAHRHGYATGGQHTLYRIWAGIKQRCGNPRNSAYPDYGARGISYFPAWEDASMFIADIMQEIGPRPSNRHTLDRRDNNGNYEPGNVRWATHVEQVQNRRRVRDLEQRIRDLEVENDLLRKCSGY